MDRLVVIRTVATLRDKPSRHLAALDGAGIVAKAIPIAVGIDHLRLSAIAHVIVVIGGGGGAGGKQEKRQKLVHAR